ncbi:MAG: class I SAM-dependent methyltransferase [Vicinamibacterales bacterium]
MADAFDRIRNYWDKHAARDPLWAVLSESSRSGGRWNVGRFFETGVHEIGSVFYQLDSRRIGVARRSALDFGCGIGRLTQALAPYFDRVVGVDVSPRMLALAADFNAFPSRVSYVSNQRDDLRIFERATFDFIISNIVLQHVPQELALGYLGEFLRLLTPGGILVFQLPSHRRAPDDTPPASGARAMADEAYQAAIAVTGVERLELEPRSQITLDVAVTNTSPLPWSAHEFGVIRVGNHWRDDDGERMLTRDDGRSSLPGVVRPGETIRVGLTITAPVEAGRYQCELDLAHEGVLWFHDKGSPTVRFAVGVGGGSGDLRHETPETRSAREARRLAPKRAIDLSAVMADERVNPHNADPGDFPMHGIPQADITALIAGRGGHLVHIENDNSCGPEWVSYRYYVQVEVPEVPKVPSVPK